MALVAVFFFTSVIGVVTGANSLITVPAMLQVGIDPRVAIATNMLALTFLSIGGTLPFLGRGLFDRRRLPLLVILTLVGSVLGALLVLVVAVEALPLLIALFMLVIVLFMLFNRGAGVAPAVAPTRAGEVAGYAATLVLGVYGGFFSGGYVTLLTAAYVAFFGMSFLQAVAVTKLVNVFSSLVATLVFAAQGLIDYRLGLVLSLTMFVGGLIGARLAMRLEGPWLRRLFLAIVILLALKTLLYDVLWRALG
jgi:uncharacterized membrane protein YfcA